MKSHRKKTSKQAKAHARRPAQRRSSTAKFEPTERETRPEKFTAMETGQVDRDEGHGALGQQGEGERQNAQLEELERMMPESDPPYRRGRKSI